MLITLAPFYGGWLLYLCNNTQHVGLQDYVPDFRLCTRTIRLHPFVQFLYWHMNFHTEHHMYAAVPCYHLGKLHRAIAHDLPIGITFDLTAIQYVRDWTLPQFYFHVMIAYAILRAEGIELGKADYVAHMFAYLRPGTMPAP